MGNVFISGHYPNQYEGTLLADGTLSSEVDLGNDEHIGLYGTGFTPGTIAFEVRPDTNSEWGRVKNADGSDVAIGAVSGTFAVSGVVLDALKPYRYVRIAINAQSNGAAFKFITKA